MALTWNDAKRVGNFIKNLCSKVNGKFEEHIDESNRRASYVCVLDEPRSIVVGASRHYFPESKDGFYEVKFMIGEKGSEVFEEAIEDFVAINIGSLNIDVLKPDEADMHVEKKEPDTQVWKANGMKIRFYHDDRVALSKMVVE